MAENKSEEIGKESSRVQLFTSNSLTVPSTQQNRMKSHKMGRQSSRESLFRPTYILQLNITLKMTTSTDVIFTSAWCDRMVAKH